MGAVEHTSAASAFLFLPLVILLIICVDHGVYPFGDQCILKVDMYHQYCPFFTEMLEKLRTGGSFAYSYNIGLGADFLSLYAYYLASPLNWLLLLCPDGAVIEFMTILVVLKIALCGLTFAYYLKEHFEKIICCFRCLPAHMRFPAMWQLTPGISCGWTVFCWRRLSY